MKDIEVVHMKCLVMKSSAEVRAVSATTTDYPNAFAGDRVGLALERLSLKCSN